MNQRNVDALTLALFRVQAQQPNGHVTINDLRGTPWPIVAARLADHGVVVAAAISDDEIDAIGYGTYGDHLSGMPDYEAGRRAIHRIAQGVP